MKKILLMIFMALVFLANGSLCGEKAQERKMLENIHWLGHDGFRINFGKTVVYLDPYKIGNQTEKADYILITHEHRDHFSPEDIAKIAKKETVLLSCKAVTDLYSGEKKILTAGDILKLGGISVEAVPAYNTNKKFHTKDSGKLGYIISFEGTRIYHAGDTDFIPEMKEMGTVRKGQSPINIALLPVSGVYVMTANEAVEAAKVLKPVFALPMHYGAGVVGTLEDAKKFKEGLKGTGIEVIIKEKE